MNLYEILDSNGTPVTGALTYMEAMRYMQTNRLNRNEYSVELHMPNRGKAVEAVEAVEAVAFAVGDMVKFTLGTTPFIGTVLCAVGTGAAAVKLPSGKEMVIDLDTIESVK